VRGVPHVRRLRGDVVSAEIDPVRLARVHDLRDGLATEADCVALATRLDDELSALGMRLVQLRPAQHDITGRGLNRARNEVFDVLRYLGLVPPLDKGGAR